MMMLRSRLSALAAPAAMGAAALMLSGCVKFGTKPPPQLLTVTAAKQPDAGASLTSENVPSLTVMMPEVPRKLANVRVPVQVNATTVAYVKDAQWTEAPRALFRELLAQTIAADGQFFVLAETQYSVKPGQKLSGELVDFSIDAQTEEAVVTYDAILIIGDGAPARKQRFTARMPVRAIKAKYVAGPINEAANDVAAQVAEWVKGE